MNDTGFFKYLWRLNGLLILVVGVYILVELIDNNGLGGESEHSSYYGSPVSASADTLVPGQMTRIRDTAVFVRSLHTGGSQQAQRGRGLGNICNLLFVDGETNDQHWLFADNDTLLRDWDTIDVRTATGGKRPVAIQYESAWEDTNGDGAVNREDSWTYWVSDLHGRNLEMLLSGVGQGPLFEVVGERLFCSYTQGSKRFSAIYELTPALKLVTRQELPLSPVPDKDRKG